jgi:monoamine oxidase
MGTVMGRLARVRFRDMSFREFLERHANEPGLADQRKFASSFVEGFDAADPARVSAKELRAERQGIGDVEHDQFRILSGYGALLDHVLGEAGAAGAEVRLSSRVRGVRWERGSVAVDVDGQHRRLHARCAIVTLPVGILKLPEDARGAVRFDPEPPGKSDALAGLEDGPVVKAVLRFREPFWEEGKLSNASFLFDPDADFPTWWTPLPLRAPVLTAWAGGPKADRLSGRGEHNILAAAVDGLASLLKLSRRRIASLLEHAEVADWGADPNSRGAYSYVLAGARGSREHLAAPVEGTLFFAGEATDTEGQASTVAGALASGERAAHEAAKALEKPMPNVQSRRGNHDHLPHGPQGAQGPARKGARAETERHQLRGGRARHR